MNIIHIFQQHFILNIILICLVNYTIIRYVINADINGTAKYRDIISIEGSNGIY